MIARRGRVRIAHAFIACLACAVPALAQDPEQLLKEAEALCVRGENVLCLGVLERIPESAPTDVLVRKHTTIVEVLASLNRLVKTIADPAAQQSIIHSARVNFHQFADMFGEGGFASHLRR